MAFAASRGERKKTLNNLRLAYGAALAEPERFRLAREVFRNAGMSAAEWAFLYAGRGGNILSRAKVQGIEHILGVLRSGRGVLLLTAHYGNWELVSPLVITRIPCEGGAVARDLSNPWFNRTILRLRRRFGVRVFRRGQAGRDYVRFLRAGNAIGILGDIDTSRGDGVFVEFFGRPAWTQQGIARLALAGNARIVPAFIARDAADPGLHVLAIEPPIPEPEGGTKEARIGAMTQSFTQAIEAAVRRRPDQWIWMHRRWRHQPDRRPRFHRGSRAERRGAAPEAGTEA